MIELVDDEAGFSALRDEWRALLQESAADTVFLTWEWLYTWWRHVGRRSRPVLLAVRQKNGRLAALGPFARSGWEPRRLRFHKTLGFLGAPLASGNVGSDYLDVIVSRKAPEALGEILAEVATAGSVLELAQIATAATAFALASGLGVLNWKVERQPGGVSPTIDLGGHTWESYLASRGREHRYSVQRKLRALRQRFAVSFDRLENESARAAALSTLIDLHHRRWRQKGASDAFSTPELRAFHEDFTRLALERGWLRLFILRLDGIAAAALYGLRYGDTFFFYQSGFDPVWGRWGVGVATMALSIEAAIAEGAKTYDMLHGEEEYKFHWANATRPLARLSLFPPGTHGYWARSFAAARSFVRPVARRVLQNP